MLEPRTVTVYHAHWIESGTNEGKMASAYSREELRVLIYGRAYSPKYGSVFYWTTDEEPE